MNFDQWLSLSEAEQIAQRKTWQPYADGYWHILRAEAARRFSAEFGAHPRIRSINSGIFHGGRLIIGVSTTLWEPEQLPLPATYLGFPVLQFCAGDLPASYRPPAA